MVFKKLHKNKFINFILIILVLAIISYFFINYYFKKQEGLTNKNDKCKKGCEIPKDKCCTGNQFVNMKTGSSMDFPVCTNYSNNSLDYCQVDSDCKSCKPFVCDDSSTCGPDNHLKPFTPCEGTTYGCCPDGVTISNKTGSNCNNINNNNNNNNNNKNNNNNIGGCQGTRYGCCPDGITASNNSGSNCPCKPGDLGCDPSTYGPSNQPKGNKWSKIGQKVGKEIADGFSLDKTEKKKKKNNNHYDHSSENSNIFNQWGNDISNFGSNMSNDISNFGSNMSNDISNIGSNVSNDISNFGSSVTNDISNVGNNLMNMF
jgi:hypothetical protein